MNIETFLFGLLVMTTSAGAATLDEIAGKQWIHGSADCAENRDPPIEVFEFDRDTYILRQNKCVHFEAPFIYVMFGKRTIFVQDTGATQSAATFPLFDTIQILIRQHDDRSRQLLVTHSHSHGDHIAGDSQFRGKPDVKLIEPTAKGVREGLEFKDWPNGESTIDLGGRKLTVLPSPGHQDEAVVVYDERTHWLLTGDSVYPGRLYVKNWPAFRASMHRAAQFVQAHPVSAVMGTHIELSKAGDQFPAGTTYQPDEASLVMTVKDLTRLDQLLQTAGEQPKQIVTPRFIVQPK